MKVIVLKAVAAAAVLLMAASSHAAPTLVRDARVFDGERVHERRSVLFDGAVIVDADFRGAPPAGARIVDGAGRTLLPGLIDAHVHAFRYLELPLLFGVTTQVDMFNSVQIMQELKTAMTAGKNGGRADMFSAGTLATAKGGHGTQFGMPIPTLATPGEAQAFVDARIAEGSHFIKIAWEEGHGAHRMNSLDAATVTALIEAAHRRGKLAVVHISTLAHARAALEMGADGLVHLFIGKDIAAADADALARLAKAKRAFVIPTWVVLESMAGVKTDGVLSDPALAGLLDREQRQSLRASYGQSPMPEQLVAPKAVIAAMHRAGVPVLAGTDAGNAGTQYGISMHQELAALVAAGMRPGEALAAATSAPARAFGLGKRGRVASGYKADLVLVEGNPLVDIASTRRIVEVWKDGESTEPLRVRQRERVARENAEPGMAPVTLPADGRISLFTKEKLASPFGMGWSPTHDGMMGGASSATLELLPLDAGAPAALAVRARVVKANFPYPWAGLAFGPGAQPMQPANLSAVKTIAFRVRGDGQRYALSMMSRGVTIPATVHFIAGPEWKEVSVPLSRFPGIDPALLTMIGFNAGPEPGDYRFEIADVRLLDK
ncbi:CIA30 family protein [Massilia agri]|uniref:CIA30 family protein n=1 Tax=Massilia agri TaxID=1886785 RepID=A0ABT2AK36_9BURK|nr:CIA30 family protein [Massilia agri]MCS0596540.1 CIA30 family protein [Massilia agri]